jgi:hypothetical protein
MHWSDERYVKLYSRDTPGWMLWPWQARALLPLLLRRLDGAGVLECGRAKPIEAVAIVVGLPLEVVSVGLEALLVDGVLESVDGGLLMPNYIEAQEATKTEAGKKRDQRERHRAQARVTVKAPVPECPAVSPSVPECPPPAYPSPAQPIPAQLKQMNPPPPVAAFEVIRPDLEAIDSWTKEDFWRAAEVTRREAGYPPQKWPHPLALSRWWGEARGVAEVRELADAFVRFAGDKHWRSTHPPAPFAGFMTQWQNFLPTKGRPC